MSFLVQGASVWTEPKRILEDGSTIKFDNNVRFFSKILILGGFNASNLLVVFPLLTSVEFMNIVRDVQSLIFFCLGFLINLLSSLNNFRCLIL